MKSTVIIEKRGERYTATVSGRYGGGYMGAFAGSNAEEAAIHASKEMLRYSQSNPEGGVLIAPAEVVSLVPEHLREIKEK